ncbi:hypothetical protein AB0I81_57830 [Nonomuraea sp. NPDC050404]|uniref:hypothetical protein n=1 Tax=Nonomuraea sp. NPDC050404 TaxID=3155783 RepID=UPI0033D23811
MHDNLPAAPCPRVPWCRLAHPAAALTDRDHVSAPLVLSDLGQRLTLFRWQAESNGTLLDQPRVRITYGPLNSRLSPAWLDLTPENADSLAEILGQLTPLSTAGLIAGLYAHAN